METIRKRTAFQSKYETPKEALLAELNRRAVSSLFEESAFESRASLYESWLEKYSWSMLFPSTFHEQLSVTAPEEFARRLMRRHFPNLNVVRYSRHSPDYSATLGLRCGFTVSVWSEEQPDIPTNLNAIMSQDAVVQNALRDLEYFHTQLPVIAARVQVLCDEISLLLRVSKYTETSHVFSWLEAMGKSDLELTASKLKLEEAESKAKEFDTKREKGEPTPMFQVPPPNVIAQAIEWRDQIRDQYTKSDVLEWVRRCLLRYKDRENRSRIDQYQYVYEELQSSGSASDRKKRRSILEAVGWPAFPPNIG